jgi:hypothetical protein
MYLDELCFWKTPVFSYFTAELSIREPAVFILLMKI